MPNTSSQAERDRLAALKSLDILDTPATEAIDALVSSLARMLGVPISLLTLLDDRRQWFKANIGLPIAETAREIAFCDHTIRDDDLLIVEDATRDRRFRDNPLVTGAPHIRFYAGAPLTMKDGQRMGSLCVIDRKPRTFTDGQAATLREMSAVAVALLESHGTARRNIQLVREANEQKAIADARSHELSLREASYLQTERFAMVGGYEIEIATDRIRFSDEAYRIHGLPVGEPVTTARTRKLFVDPAYLDLRMKHLEHGGAATDEEYEIVTPAGVHKWMRITGGIEARPNGKFFIGMVQDVTARRSVEQKLWRAANQDGLTGLANARQFAGKLEEQFVRRQQVEAASEPRCAGALVMVSIDRLKEINDTLGHDVGDALLKGAATQLSDIVGQAGFLARIGGDEFVVLMEGGVTSASLATLGDEIVTSVRPVRTDDGRTLHLQVSAGGALAAADDSSESLRQKADLALVKSKRDQRGRFVEFHEDMRSALVRRVSALRDVEQALEDGRIVPHYQPLISFETREIIALEALARMRRPDGSIVSAGAFQDALLDNRIAYTLTDQMLVQVAADAKRWLERGIELAHVGINVTTADFQAGDLHQRVRTAFETAGVPLHLLLVEVTEMVFMGGNEAAAIRTLQDLREDGVFVALDDFGTGYASLSQLLTLPVDVLKIDKTFVDRVTVDSASSSIVEGLVDLSVKLGLSVVAEGIETVEQAEHLHALGCHVGQGYLFSRPGDATTIGGLLTTPGEGIARWSRQRDVPSRHVA